jgi:hypothetical protein
MRIRLDPKKLRRELLQRIFILGIFRGWVSRYTATPLIAALSPGHSDITRFHPWSPIMTGYHLDCTSRKNSKVAQTTGTVDIFDPRLGISGHTSHRAFTCPNIHELCNNPLPRSLTTVGDYDLHSREYDGGVFRGILQCL